jgi:tetratricopeptide (TPR) repeat protein
MGSGPLDHPRLLEIEERLDRAEIDAAQRLLAELGDLPVHRVAITYFATRLLYQRGRLDSAGVIERLRELMQIEPAFPEARAMLGAAEQGTLRPDRDGFLRATLDPAALAPPIHSASSSLAHESPLERAQSVSPSTEFELHALDTVHDQLNAVGIETARIERDRFGPPRSPNVPEIPRAPMLPRFPQSVNLAPSYAPGVRSASLQFELELELPEAPRDTLPQTEPEPPASSTNFSDAPATERDPHSTPPEVFAHGHGPESMLARARTLWNRGEHDRALAHLERLEQAPLLDPELRADCACFLVEAGEPERAVLQARYAAQDDPNSLPVQLMLAWALVRAARRAPNPETIDEAERALLRLRAKPGPIPALAQALRASVLAEKGDPERAITTAQLALKLDPLALDAEAAISLACARLGRVNDAQTAWERLHELSAKEAERLCDRLQQLGVKLQDSDAKSSRSQDSALRLWDKLEIALFRGDRELAILAFERGAARELRGLVGESATDAIPLLATMAAAFFTTEPVWRHFAPFDLSLASIARVEAVLDVTYGRAPRGPLSSSTYPAQVMLASYVGECLRQGYGGKWLGSLAVAETVFVDAKHSRFAPFHELRLRLEQGKPLLFEGAEGQPTRESGAPIAIPVAPPSPWDPADWPSSRLLPRLGLAFSHSVVASYCAEFGGAPLDRSPAGLYSLDHYVTLIAPKNARPARRARWLQRSSVLIGAYLGEVLRETVGAVWRDVIGSPSGPGSYTLLLPGGGSTEPIAQAFERLSGGSSEQLSRYVLGVIDELGRGREYRPVS